MKPKLNCVLLFDDDVLTLTNNKGIIDHTNCSDYVIKRESALLGLKYIALSAEADSKLPFPDLILVDIEMPNVSGWDFLRYYKPIKENLPSKPIIYMISATEAIEGNLDVPSSFNIAGVYKKPLTPEVIDFIFDQHFDCA